MIQQMLRLAQAIYKAQRADQQAFHAETLVSDTRARLERVQGALPQFRPPQAKPASAAPARASPMRVAPAQQKKRQPEPPTRIIGPWTEAEQRIETGRELYRARFPNLPGVRTGQVSKQDLEIKYRPPAPDRERGIGM